MNKLISLLIALCFSASYGASRPPVLGHDAMVVTAQHLATDIGEQMLAKGGNAIDAAVAIGYALAVVHPCCGNIGGGGFMLIRFADGRSTFINFREKAPMGFKQAMYDQGLHKTNKMLQVGVPGTVMGLNTALKKYGKLPLATVMAPAIKLSRDGFEITQQGAKILSYGKNSFNDEMNIAAIFLRGGDTPKAGTVLHQAALSRTLSMIAHKGTDAFYQGKIADKIVQASVDHNGIMSKFDFTHYNITQMQPVSCDYRGYHIISAPPPSAGGVTICETLNILEHYPLNQLGYRSAMGTHYTVEAMRHTFADRSQYLGDPDFVKNPVDRLVSKQHAQKVRQKISAQMATDSKTIGTVSNATEGQNTTGYVVVDQSGTAVAVTYTLNRFFGANIIANDSGFFLNDELDDFNLQPGKPNQFGLIQGQANKGAPGKRPLSSMAPTIITKDGKLFMVLSTPGGSTIPTQLINVIVNVIDYGMNIQEAVDAPRLHMQWFPDKIFYEPRTFSIDTRRILEKMGHHLQLGSPWGWKHWGAVMAIKVNNKDDTLYGAIDSRRPAGSAKGL